MGNDLILLWLAALPLMGSPGPATLSLAGIGAAYGVRPGLGYLLGIVAGTAGVTVLIATGITGLILAAPGAVVIVTAIAAAYILYLAWKIATAPVIDKATAGARAPAFSGGALLALANPKAYAAIGAVYSGHILVAGDLVLDAAAKIVALAVVICVVNVGWLVFGSTLSSFLSDAKTGRIANYVFAVMLVASVALALL